MYLIHAAFVDYEQPGLHWVFGDTIFESSLHSSLAPPKISNASNTHRIAIDLFTNGNRLLKIGLNHFAQVDDTKIYFRNRCQKNIVAKSRHQALLQNT